MRLRILYLQKTHSIHIATWSKIVYQTNELYRSSQNPLFYDFESPEPQNISPNANFLTNARFYCKLHASSTNFPDLSILNFKYFKAVNNYLITFDLIYLEKRKLAKLWSFWQESTHAAVSRLDNYILCNFLQRIFRAY